MEEVSLKQVELVKTVAAFPWLPFFETWQGTVQYPWVIVTQADTTVHEIKRLSTHISTLVVSPTIPTDDSSGIWLSLMHRWTSTWLNRCVVCPGVSRLRLGE